MMFVQQDILKAYRRVASLQPSHLDEITVITSRVEKSIMLFDVPIALHSI
jgi:hypothetical protein